MKKINFLILIILLSGCTVLSPQYPPEVTVDQVIQMSKSGISPEEIISKIDESHTVYYLKSEDVVRLKQEGVAGHVIDYMLMTEKKTIEASERAKWRSYYSPRYDSWYYPYYYRSRRCE